MTNGPTKSPEPVRLSTNITGVILGVLALVGYSLSEANAALIGQIVALVVPIVLNFVAGELARRRVKPVA